MDRRTLLFSGGSLTTVIVFFSPRTNRSQFFPLGPIGHKKFGGITNFALLTADRPSLLC